MNAGQMLTRVRRQLPTATVESISDEEIRGELNIGVNEVNRLAKIYVGYSEFTSEADKNVYSLSEEIPKYLGIYKNGIWFFDSNGKSKYLFRKTKAWFDIHIRNWRDAASGNPNWYWLEGDELGFYTKFNEALTVRVHHLVKGEAMASNEAFPWTGSATELVALQAADDAIIAYARWKLSPAVGAAGEQNPLYLEFIRETKKAKTQIRRRPDMTTDYDYYPRIDGIGISS